LVSSLIGARIFYIFDNVKFFLNDPIQIIRIWAGGLSFIGGFIGATIGGYFYIKAKKLDFWMWADLFAPAIPLSYAIVRIFGCFVSGLHHGRGTSIVWAVNGTHPVTLYAALVGLVIFIKLMYLRTKNLPKGALFLIFVILYGIGRFIVDFFQDVNAIKGLTSMQWLIAITIPFVLGYFYKLWVKHITLSSE